jgi:hypothetical protein
MVGGCGSVPMQAADRTPGPVGVAKKDEVPPEGWTDEHWLHLTPPHRAPVNACHDKKNSMQ